MYKHLRRFGIALAILPVVAGTALASGPALFVCRGDSIARVRCCCLESEHRVPTPTSAPTLSFACCCDIAQVSVSTIPAVLSSGTPKMIAHQQELAPAPGAAIVPRFSSLGVAPVLLMTQPRPRAVSILLGKQSLLI